MQCHVHSGGCHDHDLQLQANWSGQLLQQITSNVNEGAERAGRVARRGGSGVVSEKQAVLESAVHVLEIKDECGCMAWEEEKEKEEEEGGVVVLLFHFFCCASASFF